MTGRSRSVVNRAVLGAVGLTLLITGSWLAATDRHLADRLPSWWPTAGTGTVLLDGDQLARLRGEGWWTPAVMAAAIGLTVLFALCAVARFSRGPTRHLALPSPRCTVRPQALADALTARVAALPGIARSHARVLPRRGRRLELALRVWLEPDTPPDAVLPALRAVTAEAGTAAAPYTARTRVRLSAASHRMPRVR
ncbi:hypothetical protein GCM10023084_70200 [Streptomyces lacrimifluminis]|uniref:Alkaline shock response membrane anchor protein AmaP n=1 Tax=Streptomyces lacrimifluminis TaxID=1500077 RepID=A0A917P572_9ACTN|nr:hypothetical protein [Streptomyces lacrimifluminis]GGJ61912.1 hypothetical protein GCM10012282_68970 [Streptomyces lacrimifluminis]